MCPPLWLGEAALEIIASLLSKALESANKFFLFIFFIRKEFIFSFPESEIPLFFLAHQHLLPLGV